MNNDLISRSGLLDSFDVCKVTEYDESGCGVEYEAVSVKAIEAAPAVDAVEVVRCRDCEHRSPSPFGHPHLRWCKILGDHCSLDFYCGFGKRKEKVR